MVITQGCHFSGAQDDTMITDGQVLSERAKDITDNQINTLSKIEKKEGWELLFDGKTTTGWRSATGNEFPTKGWKVADGALVVGESGGKESQQGGDIVTTREFSDFILMLDFKAEKKANSGIKYLGGFEFQILDSNFELEDGGIQPENRKMGCLYDLIVAENLKVNPAGEWNRAMIITLGNHVEHWLNGEKLLEFERKSPQTRALIAKSKYKDYKDFGEIDESNILLQEHGNEVSFRNIKIIELN